MIIVVTGTFRVYDAHGIWTGRTEFGVSHGEDYDTGRSIVMSGGHPRDMGAEFCKNIGEWVIFKNQEERELYGD